MNESSIAGRYPVKQAIIDFNTIATHEVVAAVTDFKGQARSIRVIAVMFTVAGPVNLTWQSATTPLTGAMEFADSGGLTHESQDGIMWTAPGEALNLASDAAVQLSGVITYVVV